MNWSSRVESSVTADGQSASLPRNKAPVWGPRPDFHHYQTVAGPPMRGATPARREDRSAAHNRCRSSPAQSISAPSPAGPATTLHRLRFESSPFVAYRNSQGHGGGTRSPPPHGISNIHYFLTLWALHVTLLLPYHFSCLVTMSIADF
jgi:hypothetical protein